jgi:hypothetical protein
MLHQLYPRKDGYADRPLYPYNPSETAALAFMAMFAIAGLLHLVLMFPYRAWFPIPLIIGSASKFTSSTHTKFPVTNLTAQWKQALTTSVPNPTTTFTRSYLSSFQLS